VRQAGNVRKQQTITIGSRSVGDGSPTYVIAEIGSNHDQDLSLALDMIAMAADAGADAVKFQSIQFDQIHHPPIESDDLREWFRRIELDEEWYPALAERAAACGVHFLSSPTYVRAIDRLCAVGVPALKIASPQVQGNLPLLRRAAETGLPLLLSMGYATYGEIARAIMLCHDAGNRDLLPMHCVSAYPVRPADARLGFLATLAAMTARPVGYSDHTLGGHMAVAAVALGACVIEKHVTVSRDREGPDHHFALTMPELRVMIEQIRDVEQAIGDGTRMTLLREEHLLRDRVRLKAFCMSPRAAGEPVTPGDITFLRATGEGIGPDELHAPARYVARRAIAAGTLLRWDDLQLTGETP